MRRYIVLAAAALVPAVSSSATRNLDGISQDLLRAGCVRAVMRDAASSQDLHSGVRRDIEVDRGEALKVSPFQVACVVRGKRLDINANVVTSSMRVWMFMLTLGSKDLEVDHTSAWTEVPLRME